MTLREWRDFMIDFDRIRHIHLIGIGGVGVSALGEILQKRGYIITGSDYKESEIVAKLRDKGIKVDIGHEPDQVEGADLIVYTSAVGEENPEIKRAMELEIPMMNRAEMLGHLMQDYKNSIAVSGTHGKTTTTSMISRILLEGETDPTLLIGAKYDEIGGTNYIGDGDIFVTEACEYKENFLNMFPNIAIIHNVEEDHLDYYDNLDHIVKAFSKFSENIVEDGHVFINFDDYNAKKIMNHSSANVISYGVIQDSDYQAKNIIYNESGFPAFDIFYKDENLGHFELDLPGHHNIMNALAAIAVTHFIGIDINIAIKGLKKFKGAALRFQNWGTIEGITYVSDYAHHPTEIKTTLQSAQKLPTKRTIAIFQPHTYSRTNELLLEFATSFQDADLTYILDIYSAGGNRDQGIGLVHSKDLVKLIKDENVNATYIESFDAMTEELKKICKPGDLVLLMGAGDIHNIKAQLIPE